MGERAPETMADSMAVLRAQVARHARALGTNQSALPGLRFHRAERTNTQSRGHAPSLSLAVIVQGRKVARVGDRELRYDADTYLVITGEVDFTSVVVEASPEAPYLSLTMQLPPEEVVKTLLVLGGDDEVDAGDPDAYAARLDAPLVGALTRLIATLDDEAERRVVAPLVTAEIVFRLLRSDAAAAIRQAAQQGGDHVRIATAMEFMQANLGRRLTVAAIARHVAMSPSHFAHRFREVARISPMNYLKHARLHQARLWLLQQGCGPAEAAARVGYQSPAHFSRDFKSQFALPPAAYARQFRDGLATAAR